MFVFLNKLVQAIEKRATLHKLKNHPRVSLGSIRLGIGDHFTLYDNAKKITIGNAVNFRNHIHVIVQEDAVLEIGDQVFMNNFCSINCLEHVSIGENTLFGENVKIYDHNHAYSRDQNGLHVSRSEFSTAPVIIGKNCWIGSNVTILKGVEIGDNTIIGAGCIVYENIPENATVINQQNLIEKKTT